MWCIDFTYIHLESGEMRYNCSILDLHRRKIVASVNGTEITARLAIQALEKAIIGNQPPKGLIVHSDQGSQFTSKEFISYCKEHHIQQSMSRAGSPTDNAGECKINCVSRERTALLIQFFK